MENENMQTLADVISGGMEEVQQPVGENQQGEGTNGEVTQQPEPGYVQRRIQHALRETEHTDYP